MEGTQATQKKSDFGEGDWPKDWVPRFVISGAHERQLPPADRLEVAFAGRSNVGKSSLLNRLVGRRTLAQTSRHPGKTQLLNLFELGSLGPRLVDLPGYGYAQVSKTVAEQIRLRILEYLQRRSRLDLLVLCLDIRRGISESDREFLEAVRSPRRGTSTSLVLWVNKIDKLGQNARQKAFREVQLEAASLRWPSSLAICFLSAHTGLGVAQARKIFVEQLLGLGWPG